MKYQFTHDQRQKGGWSRARQHALERRLAPSPLEARVQLQLQAAGWSIQPEYEIATDFPQWIDILAQKDGRKIAIEVDGSHGWHKQNAYHSKMARYDEAKARWCLAQGIPLIYVNSKSDILQLIEKEYENERL